MEYYGFNTRRKRNLDLGGAKKPLPSTEESWSHGELEEGYEEIEIENDEYEMESEKENVQIEETDLIRSKQNNQLFIDGKPFVPKQMKKKQSFNESHVRITTYLDKNLHQIIHMLLEQGQIESISKFVNDSIKENLMNKYHNSN